jgi:hypothetical protein
MSFSHTHTHSFYSQERQTHNHHLPVRRHPAYGNFQLDRVSLQCNMLRVCAPMQIIISNIKLSISNNKIKQIFFLSYVNNYFFSPTDRVSYTYWQVVFVFETWFSSFWSLEIKARGKKSSQSWSSRIEFCLSFDYTRERSLGTTDHIP